jgi:hypothetical protein
MILEAATGNSMTIKCFIWDTPATTPIDSDEDSVYLDSPRAGGKYMITGTAASMLGNLGLTQKALLTTWLCNQRSAGIEYPAITSDIINSAKSFRPLPTNERVDRAILYFNERVRVGQTIGIPPEHVEAEGSADSQLLAAVTESLTFGELIAFFEMLEAMGWLSQRFSHMHSMNYTLTPSGWLRVDQLLTRLPDTTQAFVAMWFNDATQAAYADGIEPAITDIGYRPVRIDKKEHNNKIDDEIIAEIRRSKFLVADFTCEKEKVRGGVYFEAGFAIGLGIPVIWTVAKESFGDVHFDTRQYNHIVWDTPQTLRALLKARIGAVIGDGPLRGHS